jgi:1-acyl-sn-glycerol-3-phosphate acyltransferase
MRITAGCRGALRATPPCGPIMNDTRGDGMSECRRLPASGNEVVCGRQPLVDAITMFLAHGHALAMPEIRAALERTIDEAGPGAIDVLSKRLTVAGSDWSYYPSDPLARRIHHVLAGSILRQEPIVSGAAYAARVAGKPLVIFANHLSYSDANAIDVLLQQAGLEDLASRLTVIAGPKVYANVRRRFSSLCFGTIKTPQNSELSSGAAVMSPRDVALAARRTIQTALERLRLGEALLVLAEGTRSRSGTMQPLLSAAARYLEWPGTWVLPVGLTGTERLFPIEESGLSSVPITLRIGCPVPAAVLQQRACGNRRLMMDGIGFAIAELLPSEYRGSYAADAPGCVDARRLARERFLPS